MKILHPTISDAMDGPFVEADGHRFEVLARRDKAVIIKFYAKPERVELFDDFALIY